MTVEELLIALRAWKNSEHRVYVKELISSLERFSLGTPIGTPFVVNSKNINKITIVGIENGNLIVNVE